MRFSEFFDQVPVCRLQAFAILIRTPLTGLRIINLPSIDPFFPLHVPAFRSHQGHRQVMAVDEVGEEGSGLEN